MSIIQLLELSTIHHPERYIFEPDVYIAGSERDSFIMIPPQDFISDDTPYWLMDIFDYAIGKDVNIIRFNPDSAEIVSLKKFTWH